MGWQRKVYGVVALFPEVDGGLWMVDRKHHAENKMGNYLRNEIATPPNPLARNEQGHCEEALG
jgi:hypothetical protein